MKQEIKTASQILLSAFAIAVSIFLYDKEAKAATSIVPFLIGGSTEGVQEVCCNGIIVSFSSVNSNNPWILDGEAIILPVLSKTFDNGNEMSDGYCTLGTVFPYDICITIESECESVETVPGVRLVGTSAGSCPIS